MIKQRDLIIILVAVSALTALIWFWFYFQPANEKIAALENRIETRKEELRLAEEAAGIRTQEHAVLTAEHEEVREKWETEAANIPDTFEETSALRHMQRVIYPHVDNLTISWGDSTMRENDGLWSTTVNLNFSTSYWQFLSILHDLVNADLGNRVINYSLGVAELEPGEFRYMIEGSLDNMPEHIIEQFRQSFQNYFVRGLTDTEIIGLHMLSITMQVEYISLYPGEFSLPVSVLRSQRATAVGGAG
jgi:hypothetical protein